MLQEISKEILQKELQEVSRDSNLEGSNVVVIDDKHSDMINNVLDEEVGQDYISLYRKTGDKKYLQKFYSQKNYTKVHDKISPKWKRKFELLDNLMEVKSGEKVLDVGCAAMHFKPYVESRGGIYTGLDLSSDFNPDVVGDAENLSQFTNEEFDWVVFGDILEHIPHPEKALFEGNRVGKKIIAVVPNLYRLNSLTFLPSHPSDKHIIKLRPKKWLSLFTEAGLELTHVRGFFYCISVAFWPKMGIIDMFFRLKPFLYISDYIDKHFSDRNYWKFLGQELIVVAKSGRNK